MAINLTDNIKVNAPKPSDPRYFTSSNIPWASVSAVNSGIPITERHIGLTVNINNIEYWYKDNILDLDLVVKNLFVDSTIKQLFSSSALGLSYNNITGDFSLTSGYIIPTTIEQTNWNTAYNERTLDDVTTLGNSTTNSISVYSINTTQGEGGSNDIDHNIKIGDDLFIADRDITNAMCIYGTADDSTAGIVFGQTDPTNKLDNSGSVLQWRGNALIDSTRTVAGFPLSSNVTLASLTATDTTLTLSGSYNGSVARTIGLNLSNSNNWLVSQSFSDTIILPVVSNTSFNNMISSRMDGGESRLYFESATTTGGNGARFAFNTTNGTKNVGVDWMVNNTTTLFIANRISDLTNLITGANGYKISIGISGQREFVIYTDGRFSINASANYPTRTEGFTNDFTTLFNDILYMNAAILPTTDNTRTLGNATFQWSDIRSVLGNFSGAVTARGLNSTSGKILTSGNISSSAWGVNGVNLQTLAATYTDTSTASSGTVALTTVNSFGIPILTATNANVTNTIAANVYIAGAPTVSGTTVNTNSYSLYVAAGDSRFNTNIINSSGGAFYFYNTANQNTNYERFTLSFVSNTFNLSSEGIGTGAVRPFRLFGGDASTIGVSGRTFTIRGSSAGVSGAFTFSNVTSGASSGVGTISTFTSSSGKPNGLCVLDTVSQSSTAGYTALLISPFINTKGSDVYLLLDVGKNSAGAGAGSHTSYFSVTDLGITRLTGKLLINQISDAGFTAIDVNGTSRFQNNITFTALNLILDTTTGTKIGTATSQKLSLWNATPIIQPTTSITAATFVSNTSLIANDTATFDGYTIGQIVKALRNIGALA
jgi:hypothetical protein